MIIKNKFGILIQFGIAITSFLFSMAATWYEGSGIIDNPLEWKYSTPISQMMNDQILKKDDISQLDYFIYAAKFHPTFPLIMLITGLYLFILIGYCALTGKKKWFSFYLFSLGLGLLVLSYMTFSSPTKGGQVFFVCSLAIGLLSILSAVIFYFLFAFRSKSEIPYN